VEKTLEEARAEAWRSALRLLADGYVTARETIGMTDDDLKREVLRRVLDALARSPKEANAALSASVVQSLVNGVQPYPGVLGVAAQAPQGKANGKP
jgi:acetamidase/formamidase